MIFPKNSKKVIILAHFSDFLSFFGGKFMKWGRQGIIKWFWGGFFQKLPSDPLQSNHKIEWTTLRELIFAVFADFDTNRKIKFPQNFSNAKNKGRKIHRTALIFFEVRNPQN